MNFNSSLLLTILNDMLRIFCGFHLIYFQNQFGNELHKNGKLETLLYYYLFEIELLCKIHTV